MNPPSRIIALLTDFGLRDPYVAAMKGAILSIHPDARLVDLSHDVPPRNVAAAAFLLRSCYSTYPDGTLFVAVVDPGVGTSRAILCVETERHLFLAPDNGLLSFLDKPVRIRRVTNRRLMRADIAATFHGRDVFAPVAGHLSRGLEIARVGPPARAMKKLRRPAPRIHPSGDMTGEVVAIDRFGNLITNLPRQRLARSGSWWFQAGTWRIRGLSRTYGDGEPGRPLALIGSGGLLEIAVAGGNAAEASGARIGDPVHAARGSPPAGPVAPARVAQLETNLDNASGELVGWLFERLFEDGALDVFATPIQMKKNRPGIMVSVLAPLDRARDLERLLLRESPTFGVRHRIVERTVLDRAVRVVRTRYGPIRCKVGRLEGSAIHVSPEYEDVRRAARRHGAAWEAVYRDALARYK
ncbi:MAG: SAM-dependent chlorinase/fluorinase [Planctomycetes bacterium]|nr:SAM-dependent chlorinase/fluorinase [Planctomycetota bacterium]